MATKKTSTKTTKKKDSVVTATSMAFLKNYINTPSPVGFESGGQKVWLEYIKKYTDEIFTDPYGTAVGVINPGAPFKVVIEATKNQFIVR